ncbi:MAG: beta-ketoacyl-[acyl-carrier-protein] synthase family protein [Alphaproteobacteria bacterium]|nr:beta-ketoacyl-[acyl-carrier-protein] synthase family protein [Alphaproteobacteria bacterium]
MRRVVITGLGVTCPVGFDLESFWTGLLNGKNVFAESVVLPGSGILVGAIAPTISFKDLPLKSLAPCDRNAILAVSAARSALSHAGLEGPFERPERVAVVVGNGSGGLNSVEVQYERLFRQGLRKPHPFTIIRAMVSSSSSWISLAFVTKGPTFVMSSACASATQAIGTAAELIRTNQADIAIAGGTEAPLSLGTVLAWDAMRVMSHKKCRPFSLNRDGMMISEGSGMLILESEENARRRGAVILAEIAGFGSAADGVDIVAPSPEGMARTMRLALADAGIRPGDVAYVNAHGTGTTANDSAETRAMKEVFGAHPPPMSSIKAVTGHSLGGAGAIEAVATILAMKKSVAPPTANFEEVDPECDIDVIPNTARAMPIDIAISNSFAFGGANASLVFRQPQ